jgi:hypothetical protein
MNHRLIKAVSMMMLVFAWSAGLVGAQVKKESGAAKPDCKYWQSRVDETVKAEPPSQKIDYDDDQTVLDAIECLLKMKGNKRPAAFGGNTNPRTSQILPHPTADVAALYYISFMYYKNWGHAGGVALGVDHIALNTGQSILIAYESYKKWFARVKKIGLAKAREQKLGPLAGSGIMWY